MAPTGPVLAYHHPDDSQYALQHVTGDKDRHERELATIRADDALEARAVQEAVDGTTAYLIYTSDAPDDPLPEIETEAELGAWLRERFSADDLQLVLAVFRAYRGILEETAAAGNDLTLYKQMELEVIPEVANRVEWRQSVPAVGAELLSWFILLHPMPNTNHRTGISLLDRYLTSIDGSFTMPPTGEAGEWYDWAVDYIHDSKRLLTLRTNLRVFRYAAELGYRSVRRKEGITIDLSDVRLDRADPAAYYATAHLERTRVFVEGLLEQADATELAAMEDPGKRVFVDRLRADQ